MPIPSRATLLATCLLTVAAGASAQTQNHNLVTIDATAPVPEPQPIAAPLGTATSPTGETLGVNSQYLTLNGKPWLPVMGEFHFSRYPAAEWEQEILKMQAAGVQIVSTYIIWIHHEQTQGVFDWTGQRDLRLFTQLCAKHGMYVYPRIGPWAHAEVRNGGLPDWVLKAGPTRQNDPTYLAEVATFYQQIALQLKGLLWKDGGPVIGLQVENEYRARGAGKGEEHIRTLKKMAVDDGLDVPFYTVTGWDGAAIPLDATLPVFGGYPDAPWDGSPKKLPPNEVYAFRFDNRSAGSMGAIGAGNQSAATSYRGTPFLTAEVGDGIEDTYFRRPVVTPDDVAAIPTVILGSGANLLGYYMFHGGRNPDSADPAVSLQESQITGYPTDLPLRSYDFQAPLGEFGQERESLRKLKLIHYFLNDFGPALAPMTPRRPATVPATPTDLSIPRVSARTAGASGFVFLSNHIRGVPSPARPAFQVALTLPGDATVRIPQDPITLPAETYGIWPVNLPLGPTILRYSTAQLFKRVVNSGQTYYFFFALPGVQPEFALDGNPTLDAGPAEVLRTPGLLRLRCTATLPTDLRLPGGIHLVLLPQQTAESLWRVTNPSLLLLSDAAVYSDADHWILDQEARNTFNLAIFGSARKPTADVPLKSIPRSHPLFAAYTATLPPVTLTPTITPTHPASLREPSKLGPPVSWRKNPVPLAPDDADFTASAATWAITLPTPPPAAHLSNLLLDIRYTGDVARLYRGPDLLDDNFYTGQPFQAGLRELDPTWRTAPATLTLRVLPLRRDFNLYLEDPAALHFTDHNQAAGLQSIRLIPQYRLVLTPPTP